MQERKKILAILHKEGFLTRILERYPLALVCKDNVNDIYNYLDIAYNGKNDFVDEIDISEFDRFETTKKLEKLLIKM